MSKKAKPLLWLLCLVVAACGQNDGGHHIKFYVDEYDFVDETLKGSLEAVIAEQFKEEPDVPLDITFMEPGGLLVTWDVNMNDSVVGTFDISVETHHYKYYGYYEDSLQYYVDACCMLAGHLCYIYPDSLYFKKTERKQKVSFVTHEEVCTCAETGVYLNFVNKHEVQVVPFDELLERLGSLGAVTDWCESYDSLYNTYVPEPPEPSLSRFGTDIHKVSRTLSDAEIASLSFDGYRFEKYNDDFYKKTLDSWKEYKDKYKPYYSVVTCPTCGHNLMVVFGSSPNEYWQSLCGQEGYFAICTHCRKVLDFEIVARN